MCRKADSDDITVGRQTRFYLKKPYAVLDVPARTARDVLRGMSRYWTAQPAGSDRFLDHGHHGRKSQWSPTVHGPPLTPGTPRSRCDRTEPPPRAVQPSQPALALLRLPACDGRRCLAYAAWVQRLCAALTIPSVSTSVYQRNTDLSVRLGLARVSVSALQGVPCACPATAQPMAAGPARATRCRAPASPHVVSACCTSVGRQAFLVHTRHGGRSPARSHQEERGLACPSAPNAWSSSGDMVRGKATEPCATAPEEVAVPPGQFC